MLKKMIINCVGIIGLTVLTKNAIYPSHILSIKFVSSGEEHGPGRHVQPHGEGLRGEERLDEPLAEQDLGRLLEDGQQTAVMNPDASLQQRQHILDLRQRPVLLGQDHHGVLEDLVHQLLLLGRVEVQLGHLQGVGLALLLAEAEHDDGGELPLHDHLDNLEAAGALFHAALPAHLVPLGGLAHVL